LLIIPTLAAHNSKKRHAKGHARLKNRADFPSARLLFYACFLSASRKMLLARFILS